MYSILTSAATTHKSHKISEDLIYVLHRISEHLASLKFSAIKVYMTSKDVCLRLRCGSIVEADVSWTNSHFHPIDSKSH